MTFSLPSVLQTILVASFALSLSACEVGPDYTAPDGNAPTDWVSPHAQIQASVDQAWWKNFNDPVLVGLIDEASSDNLDLKGAEARIAEARAGVSSAFADLLPKGDLKGGATREANQQALPGGDASGFAQLLKKPYNIFETGFDASWELDLFGGNRRAEEYAEAQMQASEASRDDVLVSLRAEVARTYVMIRQYQVQLQIVKDRIAADQKTLSLAKERATVGEAPHLDVVQAQAALEQDQQRLPAMRSQLTQTEYSLDVLLGAQPGITHKLVATPAPIPSSDKYILMSAPAAVIADRPDIRVAERKLASATAQQGVAAAKFFPDISLTGFFGALNTSADNLLRGSSESWMAGGSVIWPILSYGTLSANLDSANAQQQEAMASYQKSILSALSDVEKSLTAYTEQKTALQSTESEVEQNKQARAIAIERYKSGLTSFLEVLDADRTLYASQDRLAQAHADMAANLIALYKSLGGGWIRN